MDEKMLVPDVEHMFSTYRTALKKLETSLDSSFEQAISLIAKTSQHVIICGMGKSGSNGAGISRRCAAYERADPCKLLPHT